MTINEAWSLIFEQKKLNTNAPIHFVTAKEIKKITGLEPRIMAKFDQPAQMPDVFKANGYFILPIKNGEYAILKASGFHTPEGLSEPTTFKSRLRFLLSTAGRGAGEMQYLDHAFNTGMIEEAIGRGPLIQTIRGRERSRSFRLKINGHTVSVLSVQIEVDSGMEGEDCIVLAEAKIGAPTEFNIRQLYYPYRHFRLLSPNKTIIPIFFTYEPAIQRYNFWIYEFTDDEDYNSIRLVATKSYILEIENEYTEEVLRPVPPAVPEYKKLVPQANDIEKVIGLVFKVHEGLNNAAKIAEFYEFGSRQSSYYSEAAEALGLIRRIRGEYRVTNAGETLIQQPTAERNEHVVELLMGFDLVAKSAELLKKSGELSVEDIRNIIATESNLSGSTIPRRSESLKAWLKWIGEVTGTFEWTDRAFVLK